MPSPRFLTEYYNSAYQVPEERYLRAVAREAASVRDALAARHPGRGTVLEIGSSYGGMLRALQADGWTVAGIELDARAAARARERWQLDVTEAPLSAGAPPPRRYDAIVMLHVLEHIGDAGPFLDAVRAALRPGGTLLLKTPNAAASLARWTEGWWEWFAAPEHVQVYSPDSLRRVLAAHGLRVEWMRTRRGDAHGLLFELVRTGVKRATGGTRTTGGAPTGGSPVSTTGWYRSLAFVLETLGGPLDRLTQRWWARRLRGPELFVAATAV